MNGSFHNAYTISKQLSILIHSGVYNNEQIFAGNIWKKL